MCVCVCVCVCVLAPTSVIVISSHSFGRWGNKILDGGDCELVSGLCVCVWVCVWFCVCFECMSLSRTRRMTVMCVCVHMCVHAHAWVCVQAGTIHMCAFIRVAFMCGCVFFGEQGPVIMPEPGPRWNHSQVNPKHTICLGGRGRRASRRTHGPEEHVIGLNVNWNQTEAVP